MAAGDAPSHLDALDPDDRALINAFRQLCTHLPEAREEASRTEVRWKRRRIFAVAFIKSHRLEIAIDLLRKAEHSLVIDRFSTTKRVLTHRITVERAEQLDTNLQELVHEAYDTVGPGTR